MLSLFNIDDFLLKLVKFQGRSDGGYIGIYTHPKSVHLKFYGVFFLLPMRQLDQQQATASRSYWNYNLQDFLLIS